MERCLWSLSQTHLEEICSQASSAPVIQSIQVSLWLIVSNRRPYAILSCDSLKGTVMLTYPFFDMYPEMFKMILHGSFLRLKSSEVYKKKTSHTPLFLLCISILFTFMLKPFWFKKKKNLDNKQWPWLQGDEWFLYQCYGNAVFGRIITCGIQNCRNLQDTLWFYLCQSPVTLESTAWGNHLESFRLGWSWTKANVWES